MIESCGYHLFLSKTFALFFNFVLFAQEAEVECIALWLKLNESFRLAFLDEALSIIVNYWQVLYKDY